MVILSSKYTSIGGSVISPEREVNRHARAYRAILVRVQDKSAYPVIRARNFGEGKS
jgi:hypothetical protein